MQVEEIAEYWAMQRAVDGRWAHPNDDHELRRDQASFNLDHPVSPFVGNVRAEVVILGANGGYDSVRTPRNFAGKNDTSEFLAQVASGNTIEWATREEYYREANYWDWIRTGRAVVINACAYRSTRRPGKIRLPSDYFARKWLLDAIRPLLLSRQRLIVAWRPGLWREALPELGQMAGVVRENNPRSKNLSRSQCVKVSEHLQSRGVGRIPNGL